VAAYARKLPAPSPPLFPYTTLFRSYFRADARRSAASIACQRRCGRTSIDDDCSVRRDARGRGVRCEAQERSGCHEEGAGTAPVRSEEHTSELQSRGHLVCRLLLEKK